MKTLWKMEHLLFWSKSSIFHNIFKYIIFQRRQKALLWSKGLNLQVESDKPNILSMALYEKCGSVGRVLDLGPDVVSVDGPTAVKLLDFFYSGIHLYKS